MGETPLVLKDNKRRIYRQHTIESILKDEARNRASVNLYIREETENLKIILKAIPHAVSKIKGDPSDCA